MIFSLSVVPCRHSVVLATAGAQLVKLEVSCVVV